MRDADTQDGEHNGRPNEQPAVVIHPRLHARGCAGPMCSLWVLFNGFRAPCFSPSSFLVSLFFARLNSSLTDAYPFRFLSVGTMSPSHASTAQLPPLLKLQQLKLFPDAALLNGLRHIGAGTDSFGSLGFKHMAEQLGKVRSPLKPLENCRVP